MDHDSSGWRKALNLSVVYDGIQSVLGARRSRRRFLDDIVQPFAGAKIMDIGCGTAAILEYLPDDVMYFGYDINRGYINSARRNFGTRGVFACASVDEATDHHLSGSFDIVLASAILHHLNDAEAMELVNAAHRHLRPGGVLCTWDCVNIPGQPWLAGFLMARDRGRHVRDAAGYEDLISGCFLDRKTWVIDDALRVPYSIFAVRARKS